MLSCADFRIIFVLGSLGLLPRSLKIKRTNEVIDDFNFLDFHPLLLFVGRVGFGHPDLFHELTQDVASSWVMSVYFFTTEMNFLTLVFFCSCCFTSRPRVSTTAFNCSCSCS